MSSELQRKTVVTKFKCHLYFISHLSPACCGIFSTLAANGVPARSCFFVARNYFHKVIARHIGSSCIVDLMATIFESICYGFSRGGSRVTDRNIYINLLKMFIYHFLTVLPLQMAQKYWCPVVHLPAASLFRVKTALTEIKLDSFWASEGIRPFEPLFSDFIEDKNKSYVRN